MKLRVYQYSKCGTCRKALKFLAAKGIDFIAVPIRETPPTPDELERMLERYGGQIRKLFNTSSRGCPLRGQGCPVFWQRQPSD